MITNVLCSIIAVLTTNWTTISRTTPVRNDPPGVFYAISLLVTDNQIGTVATNYMLRVEWNGKTNHVLLESHPCTSCPTLQRSVSQPESWNWGQMYLNNNVGK